VIHGDIKPQNVLVFKDATGKTTVRMADFGIPLLQRVNQEGFSCRSLGRGMLPNIILVGSAYLKPNNRRTPFGMLCLWLLF